MARVDVLGFLTDDSVQVQQTNRPSVERAMLKDGVYGDEEV